MNGLRALAMAILLLLPTGLRAQEPATGTEDPAHAELRALRDAMLADFNKGDYDAMMAYVAPNAVFTPLDAQVCHGADEIKAYTDRMMKGANAIVKELKVDLKTDALAELYGGDTAIAWGSIQESFKLTEGLEFSSNDRWSATLVKQDGKWLVASLHTSSNIFDNPLLNAAKRGAMIAAIVAGLIGLILGFVVAKLIRKRPAAAEQAAP
jgi:uncharacterized protein (TIGR02246 family)